MDLVPRDQNTALDRYKIPQTSFLAPDQLQEVAAKRALREEIIASKGYLERVATNEAKRNAAHGYSATVSTLSSMCEVRERYAETEDLHREASVIYKLFKAEVTDNVLSFHQTAVEGIRRQLEQSLEPDPPPPPQPEPEQERIPTVIEIEPTLTERLFKRKWHYSV